MFVFLTIDYNQAVQDAKTSSYRDFTLHLWHILLSFISSSPSPITLSFLSPIFFHRSPRTESVAEKMLTNWFTFLLYKFLKVKLSQRCTHTDTHNCRSNSITTGV